MAISQHHGGYRVEIYQQGKRIYRSKVFPNELDAKLHEREYQEGIAETNTDFIKLCTSRLEELEIKRSKQHFKENFSIIKKILVPRWGAKKKITRDDVEEYLNEVARKSKSKANKHLRLIKALFEHGIKRNWLRINPCRGIERFPESKEQRYVPPEEDIKLVLEVASCEERKYLLVVAHTLGRVRAVNNLKWQNVFDDHVVLFTRKARHSDLKPIRVKMNAVLKEVLESIPKGGEYVFTNPKTGRPYDYRDKFLPTLCNLAGVRPFMYHAFRHFGASKLDEEGVPLTSIQEILGHERSTTTSIYLRSLGKVKDEAMSKLEGLK